MLTAAGASDNIAHLIIIVKQVGRLASIVVLVAILESLLCMNVLSAILATNG